MAKKKLVKITLEVEPDDIITSKKGIRMYQEFTQNPIKVNKIRIIDYNIAEAIDKTYKKDTRRDADKRWISWSARDVEKEIEDLNKLIDKIQKEDDHFSCDWSSQITKVITFLEGADKKHTFISDARKEYEREYEQIEAEHDKAFNEAMEKRNKITQPAEDEFWKTKEKLDKIWDEKYKQLEQKLKAAETLTRI